MSISIYIFAMRTKVIKEDWEILKRFLPDGWEHKAIELGALVRKRKIESADILLRVLLIHLADGKSLRTTSAYALEANICDINDVALLHRLKASGEWFRWMSTELVNQLKGIFLAPKREKHHEKTEMADDQHGFGPGGAIVEDISLIRKVSKTSALEWTTGMARSRYNLYLQS